MKKDENKREGYSWLVKGIYRTKKPTSWRIKKGMVPTMKKKFFFPKFDIEIQSQRQESGNLEEKRPKFSSYSQKKKKKGTLESPR